MNEDTCPDCGGFNPKTCRTCRDAATELARSLMTGDPADPIAVAAGKVVARIEEGGRTVEEPRLACPRCHRELDPEAPAKPKDGFVDSCPHCGEGFAVAEEAEGAAEISEEPGSIPGDPECGPSTPPVLTPLESLLASVASIGITAEILASGIREGKVFNGVGVYHREAASSVVAVSGASARSRTVLDGMIIPIQAATSLAKLVRLCEKTPFGQALLKKTGPDFGVQIAVADGPLVPDNEPRRPS